MRKSIIGILEGALYILIAVVTIGGFVMGGVVGRVLSNLNNPFESPSFSWPGALVGGAIGFFIGVAVTGVVFILLSINENTQRSAELLERQQRQSAVPASDSHVSAPARKTAEPANSLTDMAEKNAAFYRGTTTMKPSGAVVICPKCGEANGANRTKCFTCGTVLISDTASPES